MQVNQVPPDQQVPEDQMDPRESGEFPGQTEVLVILEPRERRDSPDK